MPSNDAPLVLGEPTEEHLVVGDDEAIPAGSTNRRKKTILISAIAVVLAAAAGLTIWLTSGTTPTGLVISTQVVSATTGTIKETVATSGTLEPSTQANLNFAVSGTVSSVAVKAGDTVAVGQVLATVGTTALTSDVNAAQAQLEAAQARLSSDQSATAGTSQIDSDEAAVTSAESSLTSAKTSLADASLTSTIAGTVASVSLSVGEQIAGSGGSNGSGGLGASSAAASSASSNSADVVVIATSSYVVNTTVDDTQIGQIVVGDQATITPTGSATTAFGTVASLGLIATESSNVATFPVVIDVTGNPPGLFDGSTADVSIIVKQLNNVVEVPTAAINYTNGQATVTKVVNGKHVSVPVTVGASQTGETQITQGVSSGDRVLERIITFTGVPGGRVGGLGGLGGAGRGFPGAGGGGFGGGGGGRFSGTGGGG